MIDGAAKAMTPKQVAERLGVAREKVVAWIVAGELAAFDVSAKRGGRPYYRISPEALEQFQRARAIIPPPRRSRSAPIPAPAVKQFY